ncbi:MAG: heme transporter ATP-binding protein [Sediminibacterium sp.]|nr:heme transporter ATP-binding protein [Sediminibacterium sp.]MCW3088632.1 heme transporter ATP-binding protein [Sediminibacterium sp.]
MIEAKGISYHVNGNFLVKDVSLSAKPGECIVIMGANGAGKSTLLKMISGALKPATGEVLFKEKKIQSYQTEELARQRAVLSQHYHLSFPMDVREIVMIGRYPYFTSSPHATDHSIVEDKLAQMEVQLLAGRNYQTLSGGEAQKVQMSRVLAQIGETSRAQQKLLLLDEPVSHLDIKYQHLLLNAAKKLCHEQVAVIAVLHDVNLALKYADTIIFMKEGKIAYTLTDPQNITAEILKNVFDTDARVFTIPGQLQKFVAY